MDRKGHWDTIYTRKAEADLSWHQDDPSTSLELMRLAGLTPGTSVIDIGAGRSRVVDRLLDMGLRDLTVLDLSDKAIAASRNRLGDRGSVVTWVVADVTTWNAARVFDIWHDRAVFHFLVDPAERASYVKRLSAALAVGGHATGAQEPRRVAGLGPVGAGESAECVEGP